MSSLFLLLFIGNLATTLFVVPEKIREKTKERYRLLSMGKSMKLRKMMKVITSIYSIISIPFMFIFQFVIVVVVFL